MAAAPTVTQNVHLFAHNVFCLFGPKIKIRILSFFGALLWFYSSISIFFPIHYFTYDYMIVYGMRYTKYCCRLRNHFCFPSFHSIVFEGTQCFRWFRPRHECMENYVNFAYVRKWFVTGPTMEWCVAETTKIRNENKWNTSNWSFFVFSRTAQCESKLLTEKPAGRRPIVNYLRFAKRCQTLMLCSFNFWVIHSLWFLHRCVCWQNDLSELYRNYHSAIFFIFTQYTICHATSRRPGPRINCSLCEK